MPIWAGVWGSSPIARRLAVDDDGDMVKRSLGWLCAMLGAVMRHIARFPECS